MAELAIVVGRRTPTSGEYGIWVSKPGYSAATASPDNCLLTMDRKLAQVEIVGTVAMNGGAGQTVNVAIPNYGFIPAVALSELNDPNLVRDVEFTVSQSAIQLVKTVADPMTIAYIVFSFTWRS